MRINELDLTRAGIISVQRDLPATDTTWETDYTIGEVLYRVVGNAFHGRPHGRDADVLLALQTLFFRAGCPENNVIEITAAQLLNESGHARNGQYYASLREALLRLGSVKWTLVRTEYNDKQKRHIGETSTTGIIAEMQVTDQATGSHRPFDTRELTESSPIKITFVPSFASSIRDGFFQILDGELLQRLGQPQPRSLYRILQAHRVTKGGSLASELKFTLQDWFNACGLEDERTDNAKRTLDLAHERLRAEGYLSDVQYQGRGRRGTITYHFSATPLPELVDLLMDRGVTRPVAETLASDHPQRIPVALKLIDERLATGWKPRSLSASAVDAVRNPAKWGYTHPKEASDAAPKTRKRVKPIVDVEQPPDPKATVLVMLKLKLGRAPSSGAVKALDALDPHGLTAVRDALQRPKEEALKLASSILLAEL